MLKEDREKKDHRDKEIHSDGEKANDTKNKDRETQTGRQRKR